MIGFDDDGSVAADERIAGQSVGARADRVVVLDDAVGTVAASSGAGINALLVDARLVRWAVAGGHALRTARIAVVPRQARAHRLVLDNAAFGVLAARMRIARILGCCWFAYHRLDG